MCYHSDLFGDVIVTLNDVTLWLDSIPELQGATNQRRNYYANNSDLYNKIKLSKLNGSFDLLIKTAENAEKYQNQTLDICKTIYKSDCIELKSLKCPPYFHVCDNPTCKIYIKRTQHEKHAAAYAKRRKYKR